MRIWPVQDAKAKFSELLDLCRAEGPQMVTKRGEEAAVLVPVEEWRRLSHERQPDIKQLLLAAEPRIDLDLARQPARRRPLPDL
jgi:prevent-host-death family protein